jgi:hypothetical protein
MRSPRIRDLCAVWVAIASGSPWGHPEARQGEHASRTCLKCDQQLRGKSRLGTWNGTPRRAGAQAPALPAPSTAGGPRFRLRTKNWVHSLCDDSFNRRAWFTSYPPAGRSGDRHGAISGSPRDRSARRECSSTHARGAVRREHRARRRYFAICRGVWQPHKPSRTFQIRPQNLAAQWQQRIAKSLHSPANRWTRRAREMERFQQLASLDYRLPTQPQGLSRRRPRVQVPSTPQKSLGNLEVAKEARQVVPPPYRQVCCIPKLEQRPHGLRDPSRDTRQTFIIGRSAVLGAFADYLDGVGHDVTVDLPLPVTTAQPTAHRQHGAGLPGLIRNQTWLGRSAVICDSVLTVSIR